MKSAEEIGQATLNRFRRHCDELQRQGEALTAEIARLADVDTESARGRAARILRRLGREPKPSLRTVQWHLQRIAQRRRHCAES